MIARALAAGAILALAAAVFAFKASSKMPDFEVYWRAGARAAAAEPLYPASDGHYQHKYLPAFALLAIPLATLPLATAKAVWFVGSAALVGALFALGLGLLPERRKRTWVLVAVTLVVMAKFIGHELVLGQVNLLLAVLMLAAVHLLTRRRHVGAGLVIALAAVIKPYAVIFVPWLAAQRAWRALAAAAAGIVLALILPAVPYGLSGGYTLHRDWWHTVTASTPPNLLNADNVSLAGMYAKWLGPGTLAGALAVVSAAALLLAAAFVFRSRAAVPAPEGLEAALLLTLIPLLSPQGWDYVFLVATPAVLFLVNYDRALSPALRGVTWVALAIVAFSLYDVMGRRAYSAFMGLAVISVCFLVVIAALIALRRHRTA